MRTRLLGAVVAAGISFSLAVVPSQLVQLTPLTGDLAGLGLAGAPLAALLALWLAPGVARGSWRMAAGLGLAMGVSAAYLGVLELALVSAFAPLVGVDPSTGFGDDLIGSLFIAVVGFPFGTLVLPITIPCGLAWAFAMRTLATGWGAHERRDRGAAT